MYTIFQLLGMDHAVFPLSAYVMRATQGCSVIRTLMCATIRILVPQDLSVPTPDQTSMYAPVQWDLQERTVR